MCPVVRLLLPHLMPDLLLILEVRQVLFRVVKGNWYQVCRLCLVRKKWGRVTDPRIVTVIQEVAARDVLRKNREIALL